MLSSVPIVTCFGPCAEFCSEAPPPSNDLFDMVVNAIHFVSCITLKLVPSSFLKTIVKLKISLLRSFLFL